MAEPGTVRSSDGAPVAMKVVDAGIVNAEQGLRPVAFRIQSSRPLARWRGPAWTHTPASAAPSGSDGPGRSSRA